MWRGAVRGSPAGDHHKSQVPASVCPVLLVTIIITMISGHGKNSLFPLALCWTRHWPCHPDHHRVTWEWDQTVLTPVTSVSGGQVHHLQLYPRALVCHDGPDTLSTSQVISKIARTGDVSLTTDGTPADRLYEISAEIKDSLTISDITASSDHSHQNISVVV